MLTDRERELRDRIRARTGQGAVYNLTNEERVALTKLIDRLTTPRAVCDEFERLARGRKVYSLRFVGSQSCLTGHRVELPGGQQCGPGEAYAREDSLADAYEALADKAVG